MRILTGILLFLIGIFFFALTIDSLGIIGNFIMHFCAFLVAVKGVRIAINKDQDAMSAKQEKHWINLKT